MVFPFIFGVLLIIFLYESNERKFVKKQVLDKKKIYQLEQENKALKHQLEASPYERESDDQE